MLAHKLWVCLVTGLKYKGSVSLFFSSAWFWWMNAAMGISSRASYSLALYEDSCVALVSSCYFEFCRPACQMSTASCVLSLPVTLSLCQDRGRSMGWQHRNQGSIWAAFVCTEGSHTVRSSQLDSSGWSPVPLNGSSNSQELEYAGESGQSCSEFVVEWAKLG